MKGVGEALQGEELAQGRDSGGVPPIQCRLRSRG